MRSIVPKLAWALQDVLVINPLQQDLAPFHWLTAWHTVLPQHHMVNLLEFRFFPAWHRVLQHWLANTPDFDEVTRWYMGWKVGCIAIHCTALHCAFKVCIVFCSHCMLCCMQNLFLMVCKPQADFLKQAGATVDQAVMSVHPELLVHTSLCSCRVSFLKI